MSVSNKVRYGDLYIKDSNEYILHRFYTDSIYLKDDNISLTNKLTNFMPLIGAGNITFNTSTSKDFPIYLKQNTNNTAIGVELKSYTDRHISLQIGRGGENRGIYDNEADGWMMYKDSSDNIHLGTNTVGGTNQPIYLKSGVPTVCNLSNIGTVTSATETITCKAGSGGSDWIYTNGASVTLDSGSYIILATGNFTSQSTEAEFRTQIYCTDNSTSYRTTSAYGKYWVSLQAIHLIKLSTSRTFVCRLATSLSTTLADCTSYIHTLRIG